MEPFEKDIRNYQSSKPTPPMICKASIDENINVSLEFKSSKKMSEEIQFEDLVRQVLDARQEALVYYNKLPQPAP